MLIVRFLRFVAGYCKVEVRGVFPERFLNLCMVNNIRLWNVVRADRYLMRLYVRRSAAKRLARLAAQSGNEAVILSQHGITYLLHRYRKRYSLVLGFALFFLLVYEMSAFVWSIEVSGNETVKSELIVQKLDELGVREGAKRSKINFRSISNEMLIQIPQLSWITVNENGSKLSVEVRERKPKPEIGDKKTPCDIVAAKTAYVLSMEVYEGETIAKINSAVAKGDLLVGGQITLPDGRVRTVASSAKVMAVVDYSLEYTCPPYLVEKEYTGREKTLRTLQIFKTGFNLFFNSRIGYEKYDKMINKYELKLGDSFYLPVTIRCVRFKEYEEVRIPISQDIQRRLCRRCIDSAAAGITGRNEVRGVKYTESIKTDGSVTMKVKFECIEDIAQRRVLS